MFVSALRQSIIFVHRWVGVVLSVLFLVWFLSGIGLMYWDFPSVRLEDRLERAPALDASLIRVSPADAAARVSASEWAPALLTTFDGRPAYRFGAGRGRQAIVYADTGEPQHDVSKAMVDRIASAWSRQSIALARVESVDDVDQWTVQLRLSDVKPLWKYSWPDGQQIYVSQASGDVVQFTTTASRWGAYIGAIPHWLYFTPLRKHGPQWSKLVISVSATGTATAMLGLVIGLWMYSPRKRYRRNDRPTAIPYRGWKRWHMVIGLVFGAGAITWAFSGMLSMDPFPAQRTSGTAARRAGESLLHTLRGRVPLSAFATKPAADVLRELAPLSVKELELTSFVGDPVYLATISPDATRVVAVGAAPQSEFDRLRLMDVLKHASEPTGGADVSVLEHYDRYYLDRKGTRPLPVVLVRLNDVRHTRLYVDPKTVRLVGSYSSDGWINRWLYHGLHSLDLPWLYAHRPLWDVVLLIFMAGGATLCLTAVVLTWRVIVRKTSSFSADSR